MLFRSGNATRPVDAAGTAQRIVFRTQRIGADMHCLPALPCAFQTRRTPPVPRYVTLQMRPHALAAVAFDEEFQQSHPFAPCRIGESHTTVLDPHAADVPQCHPPVSLFAGYAAAVEFVGERPPGSGRQSEEDRLTTQRYFENVEILLTLTDGTVIDLSNAGGSIGPEDGVTVCSKGEVFSEVLPMEDMASISVGGVVYDLTVE